MGSRRIAAIILAAGKGTRMNSARPKVLHTLAGIPMIGHVLAALNDIEVRESKVVISPEQLEVADYVAPYPAVIQDPPRGTGDAVLAAINEVSAEIDDVLVLFGDTPLLTSETMKRLLEARRDPSDPAAVVLGFYPDEPGEYGRLIINSNGDLTGIIEAKEASPEILTIGFCNAGIMAFDANRLQEILQEIGNDNSKGEYYLTDAISIAISKGWGCKAIEADNPLEVMGVNTRAELAIAEASMQDRLRSDAMRRGVTLIDPSSVWFSADTILGRDITVGPHVWFGPGVSIGNNVEIRPFCHIEGARIGEGAIIGPFARLRPGTNLGDGVHIGNYVEIKEAKLDSGVKVNHLSYIGDSVVGYDTNIGAGTITCNYNGFSKEKTEIGAQAFIGSNTAIVAPVKIGDRAIVGAGSTLTRDLPADALGLTRAKEIVREGWAADFRKRKSKTVPADKDQRDLD